ncbi:MAG: hypothetical protein Q8L53_16835 [Aestuariivirga sp.]|nr:hypothetical protein [Aestuariivirga sp.]
MTYTRGPTHFAREAVAKARADLFYQQYQTGRTLQDIGTENNMTRERVRQIITKFHGRVKKLGGHAVMGKINLAARLVRRNQLCLKKYGCSLEQFAVLKKFHCEMRKRGDSYTVSPIGAFFTQKKNAKNREIEWKLSLWEWWAIWQQSGHWLDRGRTADAYVMCRRGDVGPYSVENVYIDTASHNCASIRANLLAKAELQSEAA